MTTHDWNMLKMLLCYAFNATCIFLIWNFDVIVPGLSAFVVMMQIINTTLITSSIYGYKNKESITILNGLAVLAVLLQTIIFLANIFDYIQSQYTSFVYLIIIHIIELLVLIVSTIQASALDYIHDIIDIQMEKSDKLLVVKVNLEKNMMKTKEDYILI